MRGPRKNRWVELIEDATSFTYDHPRVIDALVAARQKHREVVVLCDKGRASQSQNTAAALRRLQSHGCQVYLVSGAPFGAFYTFRENDCRKGRRGDLHAKLLCTDFQNLVVGSCNFTNASQANAERTVSVRLSTAGADVIERDLA